MIVSNTKITIVGAGNVGATTAHIAAGRKLGDIVLIDIVKGLAEGKALDMAEAGPVQGYSGKIVGTTDWSQTVGSGIVVITSGLARKPGMSRDDLLAKNVQIVKDVSEKTAKYCPDSIVIVVSNPLDAMVYTAAKVTGFTKNRIMGMAGALDAARFSYFVASQLGVKSEDVQGILMGGHGDDMVPLPRFTTVGGIPITELLNEQTIARLVERTRKGGIEIVDLLGSSAFYAPAAGVVKMAEAIISDSKAIIPCCAWCQKEYNVGGHFVGVPAAIGKDGVEKIVELKLNIKESAELEKSVGHVRELAAKVDRLL
jgi:malate dehydrogenase